MQKNMRKQKLTNKVEGEKTVLNNSKLMMSLQFEKLADSQAVWLEAAAPVFLFPGGKHLVGL